MMVQNFLLLLDSCIVNACFVHHSASGDWNDHAAISRKTVSWFTWQLHARGSHIQVHLSVVDQATKSYCQRSSEFRMKYACHALVGVHFPEVTSKYLCCRLCSTRTVNKHSRVQCCTCKVALCIHCYQQFHKLCLWLHWFYFAFVIATVDFEM